VEGTLEDYKCLAEFHYRNPKTHPVPIRIFVLKRKDGENVGVIFYSYPPVNVFGRKKAVNRKVDIKELNKDWATISRVILHPKYRSIGLGIRLVKETLPLVGRSYIETMAVMARYNPFFEKAGMKKIVERKPDESILQAVRGLERMGFKRYLLTSVNANIKKLRTMNEKEIQAIKETLLKVKTIYYKRLIVTSRPYPRKKFFERRLKDLNIEEFAKVLSRLAVLAETKVYLFLNAEFFGNQKQ